MPAKEAKAVLALPFLFLNSRPATDSRGFYDAVILVKGHVFLIVGRLVT